MRPLIINFHKPLPTLINPQETPSKPSLLPQITEEIPSLQGGFVAAQRKNLFLLDSSGTFFRQLAV
jgi:hypothetical protein